MSNVNVATSHVITSHVIFDQGSLDCSAGVGHDGLLGCLAQVNSSYSSDGDTNATERLRHGKQRNILPFRHVSPFFFPRNISRTRGVPSTTVTGSNPRKRPSSTRRVTTTTSLASKTSSASFSPGRPRPARLLHQRKPIARSPAGGVVGEVVAVAVEEVAGEMAAVGEAEGAVKVERMAEAGGATEAGGAMETAKSPVRTTSAFPSKRHARKMRRAPRALRNPIRTGPVLSPATAAPTWRATTVASPAASAAVATANCSWTLSVSHDLGSSWMD